jgi:hypothetical protein
VIGDLAALAAARALLRTGSMRAGILLLSLALAAAACSDATPGSDGGPGGDTGAPDAGAVPACAHSACTTGGALAAGCSTCADRVCAADPTCCAGGWSEACVLEAAVSCDETCPGTGEPIVDPELRDAALEHAPAEPSHTVTPVLFVPRDLAGDPLVEPAGRLFLALAREGQGLYWHVTGGQTFALEPLETVIGEEDNAWYRADGGRVRTEVTAAIGRASDGAHDTWILWIGGGGEAGAYADADWNPALSYTAAVGEGSLYSHLAYVTGEPAWCSHIVEPTFRADCEEPSWIITAGMGALVHELGHTFGLGHEDDHAGEVPPDSFMSAHWNYFNVRSPAAAAGALSETYKERLRASPFFGAGD